MNRQYIERLVEQLNARALAVRLIEKGYNDLIEPLLLYTSTDPALSENEQREELADMVALDDKRFDRACRTARTKYHLIERDGLTGLYNRRKLDSDIGVVIAGVQRSLFHREEKEEQRLDAAYIFIDIDDFKKINDSFGHNYGDKVLQEVACALTSSVRETDRQRVYRYGGEEMAVLLFPCIPRGAYVAAERLRNAIITHTQGFGLCNGKGVTASFGIATTETAIDAESLIRQADNALYVAKRLGKDRVEVYASL